MSKSVAGAAEGTAATACPAGSAPCSGAISQLQPGSIREHYRGPTLEGAVSPNQTATKD